MSLVIALRGEPSIKIMDGKPRGVIPFVGADSESEFAQVGIGLFLPDDGKGVIWALLNPRGILRSWRGMKLLEQVNRIDQGTVCACWTVATEHDSYDTPNYLEILQDQFGGLDALQELRKKVVNSVPSSEEIDSMILAFREKGVRVGNWDLEAAIRAGRIDTSPLIETIIREAQERMAAYKKEKEET